MNVHKLRLSGLEINISLDFPALQKNSSKNGTLPENSSVNKLEMKNLSNILTNHRGTPLGLEAAFDTLNTNTLCEKSVLQRWKQKITEDS